MHNLNPTTLEIMKLREALENAQIDIEGLEVANQRLRKENRRYWDIINKVLSWKVPTNESQENYSDNIIDIESSIILSI